MTRRQIRAAAGLTALVVGASVAGCSSSGSGTPKSPLPTDQAGLSRTVQAAVATVRTAHIDVNINAAGELIKGGGSEQLTGGQLTALDVTVTLPAGLGALEVIVAGGTTYAKLPPALAGSGKPWVLVTSSSSNATVKQLAPALQAELTAAALGNYGTFIGVSDPLRYVGQATVAGVAAAHYAATVAVAKLPASVVGKDALVAGGVTSIPVDFYFDAQGRPVQTSEKFTFSGQPVSSTNTVSDFNAPVSISAPPAAEVAH